MCLNYVFHACFLYFIWINFESDLRLPNSVFWDQNCLISLQKQKKNRKIFYKFIVLLRSDPTLFLATVSCGLFDGSPVFGAGPRCDEMFLLDARQVFVGGLSVAGR